MKDKKKEINPSTMTDPFIQFVHENGGFIENENGKYFVHIFDKKSVEKEWENLNKRLKKKNRQDFCCKIRLFLKLLFIGISASGIGWFLGQIVKMKMEVGG
ncbi:MAG: hypothetical protein IKE01_06510 [Clostridia bacterium]|nr:hypothetical protein [Clostridia bacterium]